MQASQSEQPAKAQKMAGKTQSKTYYDVEIVGFNRKFLIKKYVPPKSNRGAQMIRHARHLSTLGQTGSTITNNQLMDTKIRQTPYRYVILFAYFSISLAQGLIQQGFSTIASRLAPLYQVSPSTINWTIIIFQVMCFVCYLPSVYLVDKFGIKWPLRLSALFLILGAWLRTPSQNAAFLLSGSIIASLGQSIVLNSPSKVASVWFGDNERASATAIGHAGYIIGCLFGFILPSLYLKKDVHEDEGQRFDTYLRTQNIILTGLALPALFLIKNKPDLPPSLSAAQTQLYSFWFDFKMMVTNANYLTILATQSFMFGINISIATMSSYLFAEFGFSTPEVAAIGGTFLVSGIFASIIVGIILDKYKCYKRMCNILTFLAVIALFCFNFSLPTQSLPLVLANAAVCGLLITPISTITLPLSVEVTFPLGETMSNGFLLSTTLLYGSILTLICSDLVPTQDVIYVYCGSAVVSFGSGLFIKEDLRRLGKKEQKKENKSEGYHFLEFRELQNSINY